MFLLLVSCCLDSQLWDRKGSAEPAGASRQKLSREGSDLDEGLVPQVAEPAVNRTAADAVAESQHKAGAGTIDCMLNSGCLS